MGTIQVEMKALNGIVRARMRASIGSTCESVGGLRAGVRQMSERSWFCTAKYVSLG